MSNDLKALRQRIRQLESTLHLTSAMALVATAGIRRALDAMQRAVEYEDAVTGAMVPLLRYPACRDDPLLRGSRTGGQHCLVVIAGDRGLAGGFNANILRALRREPAGARIPIGIRACRHLSEEPLPAAKMEYAQALGIAAELCAGWENGVYTQVDLLYTGYVSALSQQVRRIGLFPLSISKDAPTDLLLEPDASSILRTLLPEYVAARLLRAVRESVAAETAARRLAMDAAGRNARGMIDRLRPEYNRIRQSVVTQEISEIVAGREQGG